MWRPIAEAKKDGTKIIGWEPDDFDKGDKNVMWYEDGAWIRQGDLTNYFCTPTMFYHCPDDPK